MNREALQQFVRSGGFAWSGGYPCALLMACPYRADYVRYRVEAAE